MAQSQGEGPDDLPGRYADIEVGDDGFVVYDQENHRAWVQSTVAIDTDDIR